jgi:hypothetical protein
MGKCRAETAVSFPLDMERKHVSGDRYVFMLFYFAIERGCPEGDPD